MLIRVEGDKSHEILEDIICAFEDAEYSDSDDSISWNVSESRYFDGGVIVVRIGDKVYNLELHQEF